MFKVLGYASFFCVTVIGCHGIRLSPKRRREKAQLVYYHLNGRRHVPGCSGQDPQDTQGKHCREWGVRGLYSCFNGLHAVYTGLILEQYSSPSTIHHPLPPAATLRPFPSCSSEKHTFKHLSFYLAASDSLKGEYSRTKQICVHMKGLQPAFILKEQRRCPGCWNTRPPPPPPHPRWPAAPSSPVSRTVQGGEQEFSPTHG